MHFPPVVWVSLCKVAAVVDFAAINLLRSIIYVPIQSKYLVVSR